MPRQLVPRTRAGNTWTEARYWSFIRSALRSAFMKYPVKHQAKGNAKQITPEGVRYKCSACAGLFRDKDVQVEHTVPCGSLKSYDDLPRFVSNMFCEADGLTIMCKPCHQTKTNDERLARKETK